MTPTNTRFIGGSLDGQTRPVVGCPRECAVGKEAFEVAMTEVDFGPEIPNSSNSSNS